MSSPYDYDPPEPEYPDPPPPSTPGGDDQAPSGGGGEPGDPTVANVSRTLLSVNQAGHTATYRLVGSWAGNTSHLPLYRGFRVFHSSVLYFNQTWGGGTQTSGTVYSNTPYANDQVLVADDNTWGWQTQIRTDYYGTYGASILWFRSGAVTMTSATPTAEDITPTTATLAVVCTPNTFHSTATLQLQYKKTSDSQWTNGGTTAVAQGYSAVTFKRNISGLLASTQYQVRLIATRNTVNETSFTSATGTFTTAAGIPAVTTDAVSNLGSTTATLNGTLDINSGTGVQVYFKWGPLGNEEGNTTTLESKSADGAFYANLTGLDGSTAYYAKAYASFTTPTGSPVSGTQISFTTDVAAQTPEEYAALEDHMLIFEYDRIRKEATTVYFSVAAPQSANSNKLLDTDPDALFAVNDIKISKDGATGADVDALTNTLMGQVTNMPQVFTLPLLAAELDAEDIWIRVTDASGGPAFRDTLIHIRTKLQLGQIVVDANEIVDGHAVELTPGEDEGYGLKVNASAIGPGIFGTLSGMSLTSGAFTQVDSGSVMRLAATASGQDDMYNGHILLLTSGSNAGQARVIKDYAGTTKEVTLNAAFALVPVVANTKYVVLPGPDVWRTGPAMYRTGGELTALPTLATSDFGDLVVLLFQRFAHRITQDATTQTWYKANTSTSIFTRSVSDNGSLQDLGMLT